jgi:hypothetical protein
MQNPQAKLSNVAYGYSNLDGARAIAASNADNVLLTGWVFAAGVRADHQRNEYKYRERTSIDCLESPLVPL